MKKYIVLLRGINVGGQKKVPMANLRELLASSGFDNVQTYIQSGNVILESRLKNNHEVEKKVAELMISHFGFEVSVLARSRSEILKIFENCTFSESKKEASYFLILQQEPQKELVKQFEEINYDKEEFALTSECVYLFYESGYGNAKLNGNFFERKLKVSATARNYKTMVKLLSLSED